MFKVSSIGNDCELCGTAISCWELPASCPGFSSQLSILSHRNAVSYPMISSKFLPGFKSGDSMDVVKTETGEQF